MKKQINNYVALAALLSFVSVQAIVVEERETTQDKAEETLRRAAEVKPIPSEGLPEIEQESQLENKEPSLLKPTESDISVELDDLSSRGFISGAKAKGIAVISLARAKVVDLAKKLKNNISKVYTKLRSLKSAASRLPAEQRKAFDDKLTVLENPFRELEEITNQAIASGADQPLQDIVKKLDGLREVLGDEDTNVALRWILSEQTVPLLGEEAGQDVGELSDLIASVKSDLPALTQSLSNLSPEE